MSGGPTPPGTCRCGHGQLHHKKRDDGAGLWCLYESPRGTTCKCTAFKARQSRPNRPFWAPPPGGLKLPDRIEEIRYRLRMGYPGGKGQTGRAMRFEHAKDDVATLLAMVENQTSFIAGLVAPKNDNGVQPAHERGQGNEEPGKPGDQTHRAHDHPHYRHGS